MVLKFNIFRFILSHVYKAYKLVKSAIEACYKFSQETKFF